MLHNLGSASQPVSVLCILAHTQKNTFLALGHIRKCVCVCVCVLYLLTNIVSGVSENNVGRTLQPRLYAPPVGQLLH